MEIGRVRVALIRDREEAASTNSAVRLSSVLNFNSIPPTIAP